ncbi:hypothetical protein GCM10010428_47400 [Actinosynnema pretiosum subsp. pretiosum]
MIGGSVTGAADAVAAVTVVVAVSSATASANRAFFRTGIGLLSEGLPVTEATFGGVFAKGFRVL